VGGTDVIDMDETNYVEVTGDVVTTGRFSNSNTVGGTTFYAYSGAGGTNRGFKITSGGFELGFASSPAFGIIENGNVHLSGPSDLAGERIILWRRVTNVPTTVPAGEMIMYSQDNSGVYGMGGLTPTLTRTLCDWGRERANITLSALSVTTATSTNTDGQTWTATDSREVSGTTTGEMITVEAAFVTFTATASWASNATGHRRLSIMLKTAGPTYTKLNGVTTMGVSGAVTAQTVSFFGAVDPATDELTVQVEQSSGSNLNVDLSATLVRYTTNV